MFSTGNVTVSFNIIFLKIKNHLKKGGKYDFMIYIFLALKKQNAAYFEDFCLKYLEKTLRRAIKVIDLYNVYF